MNQYNVIVDTGVCGHEIELLIDANSKEDAKRQALNNATEMVELMLKRLHVAKIEEW